MVLGQEGHKKVVRGIIEKYLCCLKKKSDILDILRKDSLTLFEYLLVTFDWPVMLPVVLAKN